MVAEIEESRWLAAAPATMVGVCRVAVGEELWLIKNVVGVTHFLSITLLKSFKDVKLLLNDILLLQLLNQFTGSVTFG